MLKGSLSGRRIITDGYVDAKEGRAPEIVATRINVADVFLII